MAPSTTSGGSRASRPGSGAIGLRPKTRSSRKTGVRWTEAGDGSLETEVAHAERLPLLHRLSDAASGIDTLTMIEPTLDDLYAHFLNSQEAA